jgi:hypothetical protein
MATESVRVGFTSASAFGLAEAPDAADLGREGRVRLMLVSGRHDDGLWGPVGAMWLSHDRQRGGVLVNPWALWEGSEIVRGYRGALDRDWDYWSTEVWRGSNSVNEEQEEGTLSLLDELVNAL